MSNTTTTTPNRNINQIMGEADAVTLVAKNKNVFIAIFVVIVAAVIGYGSYLTFADKSKAAFNSKIFAFEAETVKTWNEKSDPKVLVEGFKKLHKETGNYAGLIPLVIKSSDLLVEQNHLSDALEILSIGQQVSGNDYANYFVLSRLAVVYEDLGQDDKAIEVLIKMNGQSVKVFEGKNYLDLGRLYLKKGDKEKAKASFTFVVEKAKDETEFVKIAKLYLAKM